MTVVVDGVLATVRKPGFYGAINTTGARAGAALQPDSVLLVGTGAAADGVPGLTQIYSVAEARSAAGAGAPLVAMAAALLEGHPYVSELWMLVVEDAGTAVAAAGQIVLAVSSPEAGTLTVAAGQRAVSVAVTSADTPTTLGEVLEAAINADIDFPFSAVNTTGTVALTAKTKGTAGNAWVFTAVVEAEGVTATITQPTSGANDFDLEDALATISAGEFSIVVSEQNSADALGVLAAHLETVSGPMEQRPGVGVAGFVGTVGNAITRASTINSGRVTLVAGRGVAAHPAELAAAFAAQVARAGDDRAAPLNGALLAGLTGPASLSDRLTRSEQESLLWNGVAPIETARSGALAIVRWVTTYMESASGAPDDALLDGMTIRVLDLVRAQVRAAVLTNLSGLKLASVALTDTTTDPAKVRTLILGVLFSLEALGQIQNVSDNADRLIVELAAGVPGRLNIEIPCAVIPGLHVVAANFNLILST